MAKVVINDLFHELSDENQRLMSATDGHKEMIQDMERQYESIQHEINTQIIPLEDIMKKSVSNDTEVEVGSSPDTKRRILRNSSKNKRQKTSVNDESDNGSDDDNSERQMVTNMKFLSESDYLLEEDGLIITKRDPKNGLILVVQLNDNCGQTLGYRCNWSDCQFVSVSKDKTKEHLKCVHNRNGLFVCQKCDNEFVSQKEINSHVIEKHSNQYQCDYKGCDYKTRHKKHLNEHLRRHTGVKPYACTHEDCDKRFTTRQELRRHTNGVHMGHKSDYALASVLAIICFT
ncbi:unnamed protein product [Oppiella nova]|uniref:C2H2-type domain-containing protein n=1 Tax=Oppiella nova TaxID=334625 RepID=A0A7R9QR08_9ACAR|nr:unnamed protein product [Oppiella nova]CAG2172303.1 unnamed protein product [Oppiella nova]